MKRCTVIWYIVFTLFVTISLIGQMESVAFQARTEVSQALHPGTHPYCSQLAGWRRSLTPLPVVNREPNEWVSMCGGRGQWRDLGIACQPRGLMDPLQMQAHWQDRTGVLHRALLAHDSVQFGQDFGVQRKRVAPPAKVGHGD